MLTSYIILKMRRWIVNLSKITVFSYQQKEKINIRKPPQDSTGYQVLKRDEGKRKRKKSKVKYAFSVKPLVTLQLLVTLELLTQKTSMNHRLNSTQQITSSVFIQYYY